MKQGNALQNCTFGWLTSTRLKQLQVGSAGKDRPCITIWKVITMRNTKWSLVGLTAALLAGTAMGQSSTQSSSSWMDWSWAEGGSWYLGAKGGGNWVGRHTRLNRNDLGSPVNGKATYDDGYIGAIQGGYAFQNGLRLELEGAWRYNQVDKVYGYRNGRGSLSNYATMVNALYDIPVDYPVTPYIGVGIGASDYSANHIRGDGMPYPGYFGGDKWSFAYQVIAGAAYNVDENVAVTLEYRFFDRPNHDYPFGVHTDYQSNSALVGVRYSFGAPVQEQAQTATFAPPPPAPPVIPRNYLVFFDFDKSDLTPEARHIVDQAAQNVKTANITRIEVTGHTDTVGSDAYNMRLSRRRAQSVAAELESQGVPSEEIAIFAKGKHDLLVPTADGVREPQNRRVQIVFPGMGSTPSS